MEPSVIERYRDRWVAIDAVGRVVADAEELDELLDLLDEDGIVGATIQRIPAPNEPLFVGLR